MAQQGDDCYFFYYSTCTKGINCGFRHCEAALGNETVCSLWKAGTCTRNVCKFRHMEIEKKRSEIPCYWENQPGGCQKNHCVFQHFKSREECEANEKQVVTKEIGQEKSIREVIAPTEPKIQPVVVNFDEESDQESITSSPMKRPSPLKRTCDVINPTGSKVILPRKDLTENSNLELGIKSLADLKQEQLLLQAKKQLAVAAELTSGSSVNSTSNIESEQEDSNVVPTRRIIIASSENEFGKPPPVRRVNLNKTDANVSGSQSNIAKRLGLQVSSDALTKPTNLQGRLGVKGRIGKGLTIGGNVKSRLGQQDGSENKAESSDEVDLAAVKIKTLAELKQEKSGNKGIAEVANENQKKIVALGKGKWAQKPSQRQRKISSDGAEQDLGKIKVKTLEEIKQEKLTQGENDKAKSSTSEMLLGKWKRKPVVKRQSSNTEDNSDLTKVKIKTLKELQMEKFKQKEENDEVITAAATSPVKKARKEQQIYQPPTRLKAIKRKVDHDEIKPTVKSSTMEEAKSKKSSLNFSVKTFSEIMAEKRVAKLAQEKAWQEQSKRAYSPIVFHEESRTIQTSSEESSESLEKEKKTNSVWSKRTNISHSSDKMEKTIKPVVFDLDETANRLSDTNKGKSDVPKIKSDVPNDKNEGTSQKQMWQPKEIVYDVKENSNKEDVLPSQSCGMEISKRKSSEAPDSSQPVIKKPSISGSVSLTKAKAADNPTVTKKLRRPSLRRSTERRRSSDSIKAEADSTKLVASREDSLLEDVNAFLGDTSDSPDITEQDDDMLLQEMEELLA